nr:vitamin K epoxide reductase family protein [Gaetbulibacter sp. 4G1]
MKSPLARLVSRVLKKNKIPFNKEELDFQIQSHPSYPSLHSVTGVLDHFNIENVAAQVPVEAQVLQQLPQCFIAQITSNQNTGLVSVEQNQQIQIISSNGAKKTFTEDEFLEVFTGVIIAVEKSEKSEELINKKEQFSIVNVLFGLIISLFVSLMFLFDASLYCISYIILTLLGIIISISIIKQEYGVSTLIGDTFCTEGDDKKDCDAVLSSKGAVIFKGYKLSDISLLYFSGVLLIAFGSIIIHSEPKLSYIFSLLALPITLYSIYYQHWVVKKWCILCLGIVSVLWGQSLIAFLHGNSFEQVSIDNLIMSLLFFSMIILAWRLIKPIILDSIALRNEKITFLKFKKNYSLFESLLAKSKKLDTKIENLKEIVLGNQSSKLELLIVTNPLCGHCKPVHKAVHNIVEKYGDIVKIRIRFNVNTDLIKGKAVLIASRILELYDVEGGFLEALNDIYGDMSSEKWFKKWGYAIDMESYMKILMKEKNWCINNNINFTPEILINGKAYPKEYNREDIVFFIEELEENHNPNISTNMQFVASL